MDLFICHVPFSISVLHGVASPRHHGIFGGGQRDLAANQL
jgi:hypothetical protein